MEEINNPFLEKLLNDSSFRNWANNNNKNDVEFWNSWIENNPDKLDIVFTAKSIVIGISFNQKLVDKNYVNDKLNVVLNEIQQKNNRKLATPKKKSDIKAYSIVAFLTLALLAIIFVFNALNSNHINYKTGFGETLNLKLSDGTLVVLNGNSEISYEKDNPRDVTLKGEAYFKVKPIYSTHAKFWVNTSDLKVEVHGTQFNVNSRKNKTDVILDEGSIKLLLKNGENKQMMPGEFVSYSDEKITHQKINKAIKYSSWRDGTYIFNNTPLVEVMKYVEDTYGFSSEFKDPKIKELIISGGIPNENLNICLSAIQKSSGIDIIIEEDKLLISLTNNH
tara:strand:- start:9839 stop:10843 length:1005 start_codon:yes stop_codon:yes gene_type:complete